MVLRVKGVRPGECKKHNGRSQVVSLEDSDDVATSDISYDEMFLKLIADMHRLVGETPPERKPAPLYMFDFSLDEIDFVIAYLPNVDFFNVFVQCRFGSFPSHKAAPILQRLLTINALVVFQNPGGFAIDQTSEEVLLIYKVPIEVVQAESLLQSIESCAAQARRWRETYFLETSFKEDDAAVVFRL